MKTSTFTLAAVTGSFIAFAALTTPASACVVSNWTKTGGNSLASTIKGRDCGGNYSVRLIGIVGDTGWLPMYKNGMSNFTAQYGDGKVLTDISMQTNGGSMSVNFVHKAATGQTYTQGNYHLASMQ